MDIDLIYGVVERIADNKLGGRIRVKSFRDNDNSGKGLIFDEFNIQEEFPTSGFVYNPRLNATGEFSIGDLVEINVKELIEVPEKDLIVHHSKISRYGAKLLDFESAVFLENGKSINLNEIEYRISGTRQNILDSTVFYIKDKDYAYGPLRFVGGKVEPRSGKEISKFSLDSLSIIKSDDLMYLFLHPPKNESLGDVDCMDRRQILDWLKGKIRDFGELGSQINQIIRVVDKIEVDNELDKIRFNRVRKFISGLEFNFQEVKNLSSLTDEWRNVFNETFEKYSTEFEKEIRNSIELRLIDYEKLKQNEIDSEKSYQENELRDLQKNRRTLVEIIEKDQRIIKKYNDDLFLIKSQLAEIEIAKYDLLEEINYISEQKQRLISDIKIHCQILEVADRKKVETHAISTYEEQIYVSAEQEYFEDYNQMLTLTRQSNIGNGDMFRSTFHLLLSHKYLIVKNEMLVIFFAKLFGNSKVVIQQVEPDWIKFQSLFENGLAYTWESATKHPNQFHFLILQDINLASIECYAKPLLDVISGIRQSIPGFTNPIPPNLYIICTPLKVGQKGEFGLKLFKDTFDGWAVLQDFPIKPFNVGRFFPIQILAIESVQDMLDDLGFPEDISLAQDFFEEYND
ncbi:hypothetical protein [Dyadobacter psychrotolerans]|uniref:Uncharacterized protein n=1 Tax=Dyadobacter psychrotolerans TaxID=2541721 RepID=A0A4R5DKS1_9BACT|nr:hypothetical protein [Dyadobacter psychrotolerans]TDE14786.1 hypothetical protein E0F88_16500 [Dyadobacter psychrotolerans]